MNVSLIRSTIGRLLMGVGGVALIGLLLVTVMPVLHLTPRPVLSGSMEPSIHTGSLLITKPVDAASVHDGEVVTVRLGNDFLTHRVVDTTAPGDPQALVTRGDANNTDDAPIQRDWVVGTPIVSVPYVGQVLVWTQSGIGFLAVVMAPLLLMLLGAAVRPRASNRESHEPVREKARALA